MHWIKCSLSLDKHDEDKEAAEKKFIEISEAHEVLSDEDKRRRYGESIDVFALPGSKNIHFRISIPYQSY